MEKAREMYAVKKFIWEGCQFHVLYEDLNPWHAIIQFESPLGDIHDKCSDYSNRAN